MNNNKPSIRLRKPTRITPKNTHLTNNTQHKNEYKLLKFEELPEYMKDNEFILDHYRANWTIKQAFFSLFLWHNETLNVWTHLIGFIIFVGLTIANLTDVPQVSDFLNVLTWSFPLNPGANAPNNSIMDTARLLDLNHGSPLDIDVTPQPVGPTQWPFFVFLSGAMFCLLSSTACHLFGCHSRRINLRLLHLDYVGITVMIVTSFFPPIYYIFESNPVWRFVYLGGITAVGGITVATMLTPALSTPRFRSFRAVLFTAMGFFGIIPAVHGCVLNWDEPQRNATLVYESVMAGSYLFGTMFYVTRVPERWKPGWFDLAGHSHQIFHCFVIMGALAHYGAALVFLESWGELAVS